MKKILLLIPIALSVGSTAWASSCASAALSVYDVSGFSCTLGDLTFSDFHYIPTAFNGGVVPSDGSVQVSTVTTGFGNETGLEFTSGWLAGSGQIIDSSISFDVSTTNSSGITDLELFVVGGATGNGAASVAEAAPTPQVDLITGFGGGVNKNTDTTTFPPGGVFSLSLNKDIGLTGGAVGLAHVSDVYNLFSEGQNTMTPEPSLVLLCVGLLGFVPVARKYFAR